MRMYLQKKYSILFLFVFLLAGAGFGQTSDLDPFLTENKAENSTNIKNFGRMLSLFLNPFDTHSGNLPLPSRLSFIVRRSIVNIPGGDRNGILGSKSRHYYDMFGVTSAVAPRLNVTLMLHSPSGTLNAGKPVAWNFNIRYNLVGTETKNHLYFSGSFAEIKHVDDYYFKQVSIEAVYNNRKWFIRYSFGVGVNRYDFKLFPQNLSSSQYPGSIIKNIFKYGAGAQYLYKKHWQLALSYSKAIYSVYQFELQYQF